MSRHRRLDKLESHGQPERWLSFVKVPDGERDETAFTMDLRGCSLPDGDLRASLLGSPDESGADKSRSCEGA